MKKSIVGRSIVLLIALLFLCYIGYQIYSFFYKPYQSEAVYPYTVSDSITLTGTAFRDESVVTTDQIGVTNYLFSDGSKVTKSSLIAEVYQNENDALAQKQIQALQEEINALKESQDPGLSLITNNETLSKQIVESLKEIVSILDERNLSSISSYRNHFLSLVNKRRFVTGQDANFNDRISELENQVQTLNASISAKPYAVYSNGTGYFSSTVDGLEGVLQESLIGEMTLEDYRSLLTQGTTPVENAIGKMIVDSEWYLAVPVPDSDIEKFKLNGSVRVDFEKDGYLDVPMTVYKVNKVQGAEEHLVILRCNYLSDVTSRFRTDAITIHFDNYYGIRIPNKAIRFENDERGVYIVDGNVFTFKKVEVIYEGDSFVLSAIDDDSNELVSTYDEVVTEGKNLYDQKLIR